jgi:hypothetical protein
LRAERALDGRKSAKYALGVVTNNNRLGSLIRVCARKPPISEIETDSGERWKAELDEKQGDLIRVKDSGEAELWCVGFP